MNISKYLNYNTIEYISVHYSNGNTESIVNNNINKDTLTQIENANYCFLVVNYINGKAEIIKGELF
ncbi:hypothetical protein [Saccharicrinis aurantiacus]|uniref:hypothetical protein n=1 Tax=Saccharicrinis aurantiacus TaxID=1849719 RepID=UPI002490A4DE|nr:hypothetical protein [Saccharicrinis aurantiacus]